MSDEMRLAIAQNAAANGRWFLALLTLINLTNGHDLLAFFAALPIGLSVVGDLHVTGKARSVLAAAVFGLGGAAALITLINAW